MPKVKRNAPKKEKQKRVHDEMHKFKHGTLKSSSGQKVTSRDQAVAIAMSESGQSNKRKKTKKK